ncbi:ABC transporter substrate-binding protein [Paeniglutamicibacter antarcticus]|uniref:ABC transporter substrate-binding protein n=1 Tax=Arthrobacter terrae TaxID=2935737 RepID=A0A931G4J2_9MICC|nr:ABC transporter substrate-binding protein [Arthrobacter terrae]MBG0738475.1 ABC transporter substrate-binding protein [Arthrobacter terrae]
MSETVDVGSILGGRYKVTAHILLTAEQDAVLEGIDQVLKRPVSILVAGPGNAENLTQGAREVATGERHANLQILDLGTSDGSTYLISSKSAAAELLDLVVPTEPYVEPFFTDTLGNEIFGMPRPESEENGGYDYVYEDNSPVEPTRPDSVAKRAPVSADSGNTGDIVPAPPAFVPSVPPVPPVLPMAQARAVPPVRPESPVRPAAPKTSDRSTGATGTAAAVNAAKANTPTAQAPQTAAEGSPAPAPAPAPAKVTLWSEEDYGSDAPAGAYRAPASFPVSARAAEEATDEETDDDDDAANAPKTSGRWLVGGVVSILIVAALIVAVTNLGGQLSGNQNAAPAVSSSQQPPASPTPTGSASKATSAAPVVVPAITSVTRLTPDAPNLGQAYDSKLPATFDGNPATFWQTLEFSNDSFAGLTSSISLVVTLKQDSDINTVTLQQLGGSGGSFRLLTNSTPTLDGATEIGTGSFTAPSITLSAPPGTKSKYVIINFTQLPKQQTFQSYPYGVKIAEITIK